MALIAREIERHQFVPVRQQRREFTSRDIRTVVPAEDPDELNPHAEVASARPDPIRQSADDRRRIQARAAQP